MVELGQFHHKGRELKNSNRHQRIGIDLNVSEIRVQYFLAMSGSPKTWLFILGCCYCWFESWPV